MMKRLNSHTLYRLFLSLFLGVVLLGTTAQGSLAAAGNDCTANTGGQSVVSGGCLSNPKPDLSIINGIGKQVIEFMLVIAGALAVIFIIIGAIRYIISNGDPGQIAGAKATLQYAIIGLLVIIFSYAMVTILVKSV